MSVINCKNLRLTVVFAAVLFVFGFILQTPRMLPLANEYPVVVALFSGAGLLAMLLSPLLMILSAVIVLFPAAARQLDLCRH